MARSLQCPQRYCRESVLVTASYGRCGQRAARIGPDRICQIRLPASVSVPFVQRRHGSYCAKPTRIRSGWPGQSLAKRIWSGSKLVYRNHRVWFLAGRNRLATIFPLSDSVPFCHRRLDNIVQNQTGSNLVLADCVRFAKRIRSGSKPVCKNHSARFWPVFPSRSRPNAKRIL